MNYPQIEVIYCDDVRDEVGGKKSILGVYSDQLIVEKLPAKIHKLCIFIRIISPVEEPTLSFEIDLLRDGVAFQKFPAQSPIVTDEQRDIGYQTLQAVISTHNMEFQSPCELSVAVRVNGSEKRGSGLTVIQRLPETEVSQMH